MNEGKMEKPFGDVGETQEIPNLDAHVQEAENIHELATAADKIFKNALAKTLVGLVGKSREEILLFFREKKIEVSKKEIDDLISETEEFKHGLESLKDTLFDGTSTKEDSIN